MAGSITHLLQRWVAGDSVAEAALLSRVYTDLRRLAGQYMRREAPGGTLQATALVHEAYIRLSASEKLEWNDRGHFFAMASRAMRRLLVDRARARDAAKRGGDFHQVTLAGEVVAESCNREEVVAVHEALKRLEELDPRQCRVVEMRYFAGLSFGEVAEAIGLSERRAKGIWKEAQIWLHRELKGGTRD
ncbi:MAG: ECF-type sigma factor [Bryobacteraceae bacterium]